MWCSKHDTRFGHTYRLLSLSLSLSPIPQHQQKKKKKKKRPTKTQNCEFFFDSFFVVEKVFRTKAQNKRHTHAQNKTKQKNTHKKDACYYSTKQVKCSGKKKKELSRTNKRASLVGALCCCVLPRWRDYSSSPLEVVVPRKRSLSLSRCVCVSANEMFRGDDDASKTTLSFLPTSKP